MAYSFMDNFKSILPGGKPTNKNALKNMGKSVVNSYSNLSKSSDSLYKKIPVVNSILAAADPVGTLEDVYQQYKTFEARKKAIQANALSGLMVNNPQANNRNPNTKMQVTPMTFNKVVKTDAQILAEQQAQIAANQPKPSTAPMYDPSKTGSTFTPAPAKSTATGKSGGGFTSVAPKKSTPAVPVQTAPVQTSTQGKYATQPTYSTAVPQAGMPTAQDTFAGIPQSYWQSYADNWGDWANANNIKYAQQNALSLKKQYESDLNQQITAQNLYTSGQNEYANRQNVYQTNLAADKEASDEATALDNYLKDQRNATINAQVAANYATQPDFIDNRNMSEYGTPSQPLLVPYNNQLNQSSLMAGLQNNVAPQQQNLADVIPQKQVIENIFASGLPTGAIPTLLSSQEASIATERARVAALEASRLPTPSLDISGAPVQSTADADFEARYKAEVDKKAAEQAIADANSKAAYDKIVAQSAANNAKWKAEADAQNKAAAEKAAYDKEVADLAARNAANVSKITAVSNTNKVGLREALSRGMMLSQGRAADVYGGRAPALLGQMVSGQQRAFTKGLGSENASFLDQFGILQQEYMNSLNAYNEQQALKKAARAAEVAKVQSTLGMGA